MVKISEEYLYLPKFTFCFRAIELEVVGWAGSSLGVVTKGSYFYHLVPGSSWFIGITCVTLQREYFYLLGVFF